MVILQFDGLSSASIVTTGGLFSFPFFLFPIKNWKLTSIRINNKINDTETQEKDRDHRSTFPTSHLVPKRQKDDSSSRYLNHLPVALREPIDSGVNGA